MTDQDLPELSKGQQVWALIAAIQFLLAVGFLGFALNTGVLRSFAIGWVALQIFGFVGALRFANGDFAHPLFKSQVMLHLIAIILLIVLIARAGGGAGA